MPTYDYRCPNGHDFSRFFKTISASRFPVQCPDCSAVAERQLSGGAGLLFKGSGFYLTDYGKNAHRKSEPSKSESKEGAATKGESAGKAEASKPADKAPTAAPADTKPTATPSPKKAD